MFPTFLLTNVEAWPLETNLEMYVTKTQQIESSELKTSDYYLNS